MKTAKEKYDELGLDLVVAAREYFMVLRLAIYHTDHYYAEKSTDVVQYLNTNEDADGIYELACKILKALNQERRK